MRFWLREVLGWLMIGLGLYVFYICVVVLLDPRLEWHPFLQLGPMILIGFIVFRGGIHLLKVAVAARACLHAQAEITRQATEQARRPSRPAPWEE